MQTSISGVLYTSLALTTTRDILHREHHTRRRATTLTSPQNMLSATSSPSTADDEKPSLNSDDDSTRDFVFNLDVLGRGGSYAVRRGKRHSRLRFYPGVHKGSNLGPRTSVGVKGADTSIDRTYISLT